MVIYGGSLKIGILGGIGPEATGEFYHRLVRGLQQTGLIRNNTDYPQIIINSIPAPELVGRISVDVLDRQLTPYKEGLKQLDSFGVDIIVMACNTIHVYRDRLQEGISAPIMDLRQEVQLGMIRRGPGFDRKGKDRIGKIAVLGTPSTVSQGLYNFPGFNYVELSYQDVDALSAAISKYNKGEDKSKQQKIVESIARKYLKNGAGTILIACTEPSVMLKKVNIPKIDTLDILVESVIKKFRDQKYPPSRPYYF